MGVISTLVVGASTNPSRYSYKAIHLLRDHGHTVKALGLKKGKVKDVEITNELILYDDIHTITLYVSPQNQFRFYDYIESLRPQRVIFNPGTENPIFEERLKKLGIQIDISCTLVLLTTNQY